MRAPLHIEITDGVRGVDPAAWDALVAPDDPFTEHAFLALLEESGSVGPETGWVPRPVLVRRDGRLVGAAPAYVKSHSYGEYIFDWGWAQAARRAGVTYYPKLVVAVPHTPATGSRLLVAPHEDRAEVTDALVEGLRRLADDTRCSSIHLLFTTEAERHALGERGFLRRSSYQFHWQDTGYGSFDGFLAALRAPARKQLRRERRDAAALGLDVAVLRGDAIGAADWAAMRRFYHTTAAEKGAYPYLSDAFFDLAPRRVAHTALLVLARHRGEPVAGSLCFQRGRHLYGRYWGAAEDLPMLHFELCYYVPIDECLRRGWTRFEAGAQGEHKLKRGFLPTETCSAHWLRHPGLSRAVAEWLPHEAGAVAQEMAILAAHGPFRRCDGGEG